MTTRFGCEEARRCLDELAFGSLSEAEQAALDVHLAVCDECREREQLWAGLQVALREEPLPELEPLTERRMLSGREPAIPLRRRQVRPVWAWVAAAAAVAAVTVLTLTLGPWLQGTRPGGGEVAPIPVAETGGDQGAAEEIGAPAPMIRVLDGRRVVPGVREGTALWLEPDTDVQIERNDDQRADFTLRRGLVVAEIGQNREGYRFTVETPRARVVAHGTIFSVEITEQGEEIYRVSQGVVEVAPREPGRSSTQLGEGLQLHGGAQVAVIAPAEGLERDRALRTGITAVADADELVATEPAAGELLAMVDPASVAAPAPPSIEALTRMAQQHQVARQYDEACETYQLLIETHPDSTAALNGHVALAQMQLDAMDHPEDSLGHFEAYLSAAPAGTLASEAAVGRVRALDRLGRHDELIRAADEFVAAHPDGSACPEVVRLRADARRAEADCERAREDYEELIERWPDSPQADHAKAGLAACNLVDPS